MAQYTLVQLAMPLNDSIQFEAKIEKAGNSSRTYYGQFKFHPRDVCKYDTNHRYGRYSVNYMSQRDSDSEGFRRTLYRDRFCSQNPFRE